MPIVLDELTESVALTPETDTCVTGKVTAHSSGSDSVDQQMLPDRALPSYIWLKVPLEWCVSLILLVISSPLVLILAALVKLSSSGPVFYAQTRLGLNGRPFRIFKLRSMRHGAEHGKGAVWAARQDDRVTAIGRVLRASHLDELPQLWNVLRGEMSLIGPRPERPEIAGNITKMVPDFPKRLAVRPGITGLAQLLLPADDPNDEGFHCVRRKLGHDLIYISRLSLFLDLRIAVGTPCYFLAVAVSSIPQLVLSPYLKAMDSTVVSSLASGEACEQAA